MRFPHTKPDARHNHGQHFFSDIWKSNRWIALQFLVCEPLSSTLSWSEKLWSAPTCPPGQRCAKTKREKYCFDDVVFEVECNISAFLWREMNWVSPEVVLPLFSQNFVLFLLKSGEGVVRESPDTCRKSDCVCLPHHVFFRRRGSVFLTVVAKALPVQRKFEKCKFETTTFPACCAVPFRHFADCWSQNFKMSSKTETKNWIRLIRRRDRSPPKKRSRGRGRSSTCLETLSSLVRILCMFYLFRLKWRLRRRVYGTFYKWTSYFTQKYEKFYKLTFYFTQKYSWFVCFNVGEGYAMPNPTCAVYLMHFCYFLKFSVRLTSGCFSWWILADSSMLFRSPGHLINALCDGTRRDSVFSNPQVTFFSNKTHDNSDLRPDFQYTSVWSSQINDTFYDDFFKHEFLKANQRSASDAGALFKISGAQIESWPSSVPS